MAEQTAEGKKAEASSDNPILKYLGSALFAAVVAFLTWLTAEHTELRAALTTLAGVVGGVCALVTALLYARYLGVLGAGAAPARSPERLAYVRLRKSIAEGGRPARIYAEWLTKFLDAVDRFFGDAGMADRTLFPRAFGLKTPAPLWTAPSFDRCLLLALVYPIATIYIIWAVSGHVGPAEAALQLSPGFLGWKRVFLVASLGIFLATRSTSSASFASAGAGAFAVVALAFAVALAVKVLNKMAIAHRSHGAFLSLFLVAMILACLSMARFLSPSDFWAVGSPLLLFLGLLTLLNAPYDWASLGLTRRASGRSDHCTPWTHDGSRRPGVR
jgi:hypothetical protein